MAECPSALLLSFAEDHFLFSVSVMYTDLFFFFLFFLSIPSYRADVVTLFGIDHPNGRPSNKKKILKHVSLFSSFIKV